jgi:hypothetical protein
MAQLGKGKLNYRCPSCFILICSIIRKQVFIAASVVSSEAQRKRCFRATRMYARSTRLCTRDSTSSILIKVVIGTLLL